MIMETVQEMQTECIASTLTARSEESRSTKNETFAKSLQWSPDGTCLLTHSEDNKVRTYILPPDLLSPRTQPLHLEPYTIHALPEPSYAITPYPHFNLSDPSTTLLLSSPRDHPLRLTNILDPSATPIPIATYPLINTHTEKYITPHSLLFTRDGHHIIAGGPSLLATFDVSRPGEQAQSWLPTIPSRRSKLVGGGVGMRGIVSALAEAPADRWLAAGTFSRWVGLYDSAGRGDTLAVFPLSHGATSTADGAGVTSLHWTPCGRYLLVAERRSECTLLYDIRVTGKLLARLIGRRADTNQRMGVALVPRANPDPPTSPLTASPASTSQSGTTDVYAGGTDGMVRVWQDITAHEGDVAHTAEWRAHSDAVPSMSFHPSSALSLVATCAGQRHFEGPDYVIEGEVAGEDGGRDHGDNSMKVWNLLT